MKGSGRWEIGLMIAFFKFRAFLKSAKSTCASCVTRSAPRERRTSVGRKEFALLEYFMRNVGKIPTRQMILERVWGAAVDPFTNTIDVHVRFLRSKFDDGRAAGSSSSRPCADPVTT